MQKQHLFFPSKAQCEILLQGWRPHCASAGLQLLLIQPAGAPHHSKSHFGGIFSAQPHPCSVLPQCRGCWPGQGGEVAPWGHPGLCPGQGMSLSVALLSPPPALGAGRVPSTAEALGVPTMIPADPSWSQLVPVDPSPLGLPGRNLPSSFTHSYKETSTLWGCKFLWLSL